MSVKRRMTAAACGVAMVIGLTAAVWGDHHLSGEGGEAGFVSLFNGTDLTGWKGDMRYWSVQDGAITAQTEEGRLLRYNTFLIYNEEQVADFELRLSYRIVGGNSGIQYRSAVLDDDRYVVGGYQADIDSSPVYSGIMYEERGRGILAQRGQSVVIEPNGNINQVGTFGDRDALQSLIKAEDWNEYTIIARGNTMTHIINGHEMSRVVDNQKEPAAYKGILALQAHAGPPMIVQFKNIRIKRFD